MEKHGRFSSQSCEFSGGVTGEKSVTYLLLISSKKPRSFSWLIQPRIRSWEELVEKLMQSLFSRCWWFQRFFIFTDEHIVQMAWNHQPGFLLKSKTWYTGVTDVSMTKPTDLILTSVSLFGITKFQLRLDQLVGQYVDTRLVHCCHGKSTHRTGKFTNPKSVNWWNAWTWMETRKKTTYRQ